MTAKRRPLSRSLWQFGDRGTGRTFVCFPFAGGSAYSLSDWATHLRVRDETALVLQYPGRGSRLAEPAPDRLVDIADEAAEEIQARIEGPLVLAGHSMGGVLAYEVAVRLRSTGFPVEHLIVSAARPPGRQRLRADLVDRMGREDWLREVGAGGYGAGEGDDDGLDLSDVLDLMLPVLRGDYLMLAEHRPVPGGVDCPILSVGGSADPWVPEASLAGWREWTTHGCRTAVVSGGHFYYRDHMSRFTQEVRKVLEPQPQFCEEEP